MPSLKERSSMNITSARRPALVLGLLAGLASLPAFAAEPAKNPTVAVVNGTEIHMSQLVEFARSLPPQLGQPPYEALVDIVVRNQLVYEAAKRDKLDSDPEVKAALKLVEQKLMTQAWIKRKLRTELTDEALKRQYDKSLAEYQPQEEVHARHVLVETEEQANAVFAELKKGADFAEVAKAKSKDPSARQNGGDLGYFSKGEMVPQFAEAAFAAMPGALVDKPVKTQFGYHVIKVEDKRMSSAPAFEQAKPALREQMADQAAERIVGELASKAKIKRFAPDGQPLPEQGGAKAEKGKK
jgi:peptidyl-prolyl cis-trans isomerase C